MRRINALLTAGIASAALAVGWVVWRPSQPQVSHVSQARPGSVATSQADTVGSAAPAADASRPGAADETPPAARAKPAESHRPAAVSRAERPPRSLLPLAQPLWSELTPTQQFVLAPFADQWNALPQAEKLSWVRLADRVPQMPAEQQDKAHERIGEWAALSPEQRRLARQNYRLARQLPPDERVAEWQHYETLTDEQKDVLRSAGRTSNTAARHAGARTALAKEVPKPIAPLVP